MRIVARCLAPLCAALLLFTAACDSPQEREQKYLESGIALFEGGDLVKARLEFKNALQINPVNAQAQYYLGLIAEKQSDLSNASVAFRKAADADPKFFDANLKAGQLALMSGDAQAASGYADRVVELRPDGPEGHNLKAAVLLLQGRLPDAEKEARAALALDPDNVDATVILAGRLARDGRSDDALAVIDDGLRQNQDSVDLLLVRLKLLFDQKRTDDVIAVLRQLHAARPDNPNFAVDLANQLAGAGKLAEAENIFKNALQGSKNPEALVGAYAAFLASREGLDQAILEIKGLIDANKLQQRHALLLEQLYLKAGRLDDAAALMTDLEQKATAAETRLQAKVELARITLLKNDEAGALKQIEAVLTEDAENEPALLLRGLMMLNDSKFDNAIADARSVLRNNVNSAGGLSVLARAYAATGDTDLAIQTYRSLIRVAPTDVDARLKLAGLLASKSPTDALDQLDAAIALRPDAAELQVQKAEFLIATGSPDKAEVIGNQLITHPKLGASGHLILAETALVRGDHAAAITELGMAQDKGLPFATVGPVLVNAYVRAGKGAEADKLLAQRIAADPADTSAVHLLAVLRARDGKSQDAEELFRRAIEAAPDKPQPYLDLSQLLSGQKKYKEAADLLETARARFPGDSRVLTYAAIAQDSAGNFDAAKKAYEQLMQESPGNTVAANNLAALIADVWSTDAALLDRARQLAEPFRNLSSPILLDTLGWVAARQGNFDDATILLEKAASMAPDNQQIQFHYAVALAGKGLEDKAREAVGKAIQGTPDFRGLDEARQLAEKLK